jgi:uroporphyrinogen decarboxylase
MEHEKMTPWERFATVARGGQADRVPVALLVDSPWLPGYAGIGTLDYFLRPDEWLRIHLGLMERFPDVTWIPGWWIEYGMAAEPSAFGARIVWHLDQPPSIEPIKGGLASLADIEPPDPQRHGLMPLVLQRYTDAEHRFLPEGMPIHMVAARGPLAVASWLLGVTDLMIALKLQPEAASCLLDVLTTTTIVWQRRNSACCARRKASWCWMTLWGCFRPSCSSNSFVRISLASLPSSAG